MGRKHVRTLMDRMGIAAIYRRRNTSAPHPAHKIYPYRLRNLTIERPNHVWATDLTYISMKRGFAFLVAILDWATRKVPAHRVSPSMTPDFCVEALEEAIENYGPPEIFNTDDRLRLGSSRARRSPMCSRSMRSRSEWTARAAGWTTCSLNGCGRV